MECTEKDSVLDSKIMFGFFGFYREGHQCSYNLDIRSYQSYLYTPFTLNEDTENVCSKDEIVLKFGTDSKILQYEYDKKIHIEKTKLYHTGKFINQWYQQGYRIFSFFYNIQGVLKLIKKDPHDPDDIIVLCRIDVGLNIQQEKIRELLDYHDVVVRSMGDRSVDDKVFVFKYKHIDIFIKLYDDYGSYIQKVIQTDPDRPDSTRPEDILYYHFIKHHLRITAGALYVDFHHVCSKYCGHHGEYTIT